MKKPVFTGCATALMTPFDKRLKIDFDALSRLIDRQLDAGVSALTVCATTGEAATLSDDEAGEITELAVKKCGGRVPVITGTGRNSTDATLRLSRLAEKCGAAALLCVTPYYNKTTQSGLIEHYYYIADRVNIPLIVYNVPSRTGMSITPETYAALSKHPDIYGAKEASGDLSLLLRAAALCKSDFSFYSGNDDLIYAFYAHGGRGVISTVSNILPERVASLCRAFEKGEEKESLSLQKSLLPVCDALFAEVNPIPLKAAAKMLGLCGEELRLPLSKASESTRTLIKKALEK